MMLAHLNKVPVPPSQKVASAVPASLDRAVMMCLAKSPADRPASAETLSGLLDTLDHVGSWTLKDAASWWQSEHVRTAYLRGCRCQSGADRIRSFANVIVEFSQTSEQISIAWICFQSSTLRRQRLTLPVLLQGT